MSFFNTFNNYCIGPKAIKADKLYNHFLSTGIKSQIPNLSTDFDGMKTWLISEYGRIEVIVGEMVTELEKRRRSTNPEPQERLELLMAIITTIAKLKSLVPHLPGIDINVHITNHTFLTRIKNLLQSEDSIGLSISLSDRGLNARIMSGQETLDALMVYCKKVTDALEPIVSKLRSKPKIKAVHQVSEENTGVKVAAVSVPVVNVSRAPEKKWVRPAPWWTTGLKFPCGMMNHDHEVFTCPDFFQMTPGDRRDYIPPNRVCRTCLGPRDLCQTGRICSNKVPSKIICPGCDKFARSKQLSPHNVLFCMQTKPDHAKPPLSELLEAFNKYF